MEQKNKKLRQSAADQDPEASPNPPAARSRSVRPEPGAPSRFRQSAARALGVAKSILGVALVLGVTALVAIGARHYATTSPRFAIKTVSVVGNARLGPEEIAQAGGIALDQNIFAVELEEAQKKIEAAPWIKTAVVTRKLPGAVIVNVTEHEAAALVSVGATLFLVAASGDIFKEVSPEDPLDLPVITGLGPDDVSSDREGVEKRIARALEIVQEAEKRPALSRYPVQEARLHKDGTVDLIIGRDGIVLSLGQAPYRGKLEQAERVLAETAAKKAQPAVVFLDNEAHPERVVVRMR